MPSKEKAAKKANSTKKTRPDIAQQGRKQTTEKTYE
jgi:hypothetical protein